MESEIKRESMRLRRHFLWKIQFNLLFAIYQGLVYYKTPTILLPSIILHEGFVFIKAKDNNIVASERDYNLFRVCFVCLDLDSEIKELEDKQKLKINIAEDWWVKITPFLKKFSQYNPRINKSSDRD